MPLIISSAAWKSAITPSFRGRTVLMFSWVLPCTCCACRPIAITLPVVRSLATMLGSSTTTLSLWMIKVFAVPRSMAISWVKKLLNQPIGLSVCEVSVTGHAHRGPACIAGVDAVLVAFAATGLYDGRDTRVRRDLHAVREREERITGHHRPVQVEAEPARL